MATANSSLALFSLAAQEKEEEREATRVWLIEYASYRADTEDYFAYHDEDKRKVHVLGGNTEYFSCSLQYDARSGDLLLVIESKGDKKVEVNLSYNIDNNTFTRLFNAKNDTTGFNFVMNTKVDLSAVFSQNRETAIIERRGIAYLYEGEMYVKRIKIWDMKIWDDLVQEAEKHRDANFKLEYRLVLKVDETFYVTKATCEISARTIRALKNVRATQERQAASAPPKTEYSDRQLRVTIDKGEKGESLIKLEPVRITPEITTE